MAQRSPTAAEARVAAVGLLFGAVAFADLVGSDPGPGDAWGGVSMFSFAAILAFLVPAASLLGIGRHRFRDGNLRERWPVIVMALSAIGMACAAIAHVVDDGSNLGLLAAAIGSVALVHGASRLQAERGLSLGPARITRLLRSR